MSNQSNSHSQSSNLERTKSDEELTDDLDFWNIDSAKQRTTSGPEDEEEIEEEPESNQEQEESTPVSDESSESPLFTSNADKDGEITSAPKLKLPFTKAEKLASIACYISILGVFTFLIYYFSQQHNFDTKKPYAANTPVKGDYASIEDIETWWSEPDKNKVNVGSILTPAATITLDSDSKSGVIRSMFYSYEEGLLGELKPKGDALTHEFVNGKFKESGTNQITVHCTEGFEKIAHYMYYRNQDESRWTIKVSEAASVDEDISSFKPVAHAPIEPVQK